MIFITKHTKKYIFLALPICVLFVLVGCQLGQAQQMEIHQSTSGEWATYIPGEFREQFRQTGEYPIISRIVAAPDGAFWFATTGSVASVGVGAYRFDGETWTHISSESGLPYDEIMSMAITPDGAVWFALYRRGIARFYENTWTTYTVDDGLASNDVRSIAVAPDEAIWFGTADNGVSRFDGKSWQSYNTTNGLWGEYVGNIFVLPDNSLLFSSSDGVAAKLTRFDGQHWIDYPTPLTEVGYYTEDMAMTSNGDFWFATEHSGIYRLSGDTWSGYSVEDGLASDNIWCAAVTPDDIVWFGTWAGISYFDGTNWSNLNSIENVGINWVTACTVASDGSIWFGYNGGIAHYIPLDS